MKKISVILLLVLFVGCVEPVLQPNEYVIVDTIEEEKNGFNKILSYTVVVQVKEDSSLHYAKMLPDGDLYEITFKKIKNYYK